MPDPFSPFFGNQTPYYGTPGFNPYAEDPREMLRRLAEKSNFGGAPIPPGPTPTQPKGRFAGFANKVNTGLQSPLGTMGLNLLASSGPSLRPQSFLGNLGQAGLSTQSQLQNRGLLDLQKQLIESQIGRNKRGSLGPDLFGKIDPSDFTPASLSKFQSSGDYADLEIMENASSDPSAVAEFKYFQGLNSEQQREYLKVKRASRFENIPGAGAGEIDPLSGQMTPSVPEEQIVSGGAARAGATETAKQQAQNAAKQNELNQANQRTLAIWKTARQGLVEGLEGTRTGPASGRIPAVTTGQQVAEGAIAAVAPVLKQLFRAAGEGIFTDKDQELLLDMVPKRTDTPEARKIKMANIDAIINAKLGGISSSTGASNVIDFNDLPP